MSIGKPLWKTLAVSPRVKLELSYGPPIPLLGIYPRKIKIYVHTKTYKEMIKAAASVIFTR